MAAYGLQIKDPNTGKILISLTDRISRIVGSIAMGTAATGTLTVPGEGTAFFLPLGGPPAYAAHAPDCHFTVSGNTISWRWTNYSSYYPIPNMTLMYGLF